jgi:hypothetical protein
MSASLPNPMAYEPLRRRIGHSFENAGLLEEMRTVRDDREPLLACEKPHRLLLERKDLPVVSSADRAYTNVPAGEGPPPFGGGVAVV